MNQTESHVGASAIIPARTGYWDVTCHQKGGYFRRTPEDLPFTIEGKRDGDYWGVLADGRTKVCASAHLTRVDQGER